MLRSLNLMTQLHFEGIYFDGQHIFDPANNSSWAARTKAILPAI